MNAQLTAARRQVRELATKALAIVEDDGLTMAVKSAQLDSIEKTISAAEAEIERLKGMDSARTRLPFMRAAGDAGAVSRRTASDLAGIGLKTFAAPPARLDVDTVREMFEAARSRKSYAADVDIKTTDSAAITPAGIPDFDRDPAYVHREPNRILDLIPSRATSSPVVEYFVQTTKATAGVVAEGALKPGSDLALPMQTAHAAKIAAWVDCTDEALADFDQFLSMVTNDLTAAVIDAENLEMLSGTGVGPRYITGLLSTTGIITRAFDSVNDTYALDTLDLAMADLRNGPAFAEVAAWVLHPTTFSKTRRAKTTQGVYVLNADPSAETAQTLWGKPVILTTQMPTGVALGADFADACRGFVRDGIRVTLSNSTTDASGVSNFKKNVTTVLAEERVGMYVRRPAAVVKVTGLPT